MTLLTETGILVISSSFFAALALGIRATLKSNCQEASCCCDCFRCKRETTEDIAQLDVASEPRNDARNDQT